MRYETFKLFQRKLTILACDKDFAVAKMTDNWDTWVWQMNIWVNDHLASSLSCILPFSYDLHQFFFFFNHVRFENSSHLFLTFDLVLKTVQHWMIISVQDCSDVWQVKEAHQSPSRSSVQQRCLLRTVLARADRLCAPTAQTAWWPVSRSTEATPPLFVKAYYWSQRWKAVELMWQSEADKVFLIFKTDVDFFFFIANWDVISWLISYIFVYCCCCYYINCIEERKFKLLTTFQKCPVTRARSRTGQCLCSFLTRHVMAGATTEHPVLLQLHTSVTHPRGLTVRLHEVAGFGFVALQNKMLQSGGSVNALYL